MVLDPGTALAIVSLSFDLFAGCIKGFVILSDARNFGQDGMVGRTKLMVQEHRLVEWAKAINLVESQSPVISGLNTNLAGTLLAGLQDLLLSAKTLKKRYNLELRDALPEEEASLEKANGELEHDPTALSILSTVVSRQDRQRILERSPSISIPKRLWWASVDKKRFGQLVEDVESLVDGLWALLDPLQRLQTSQALANTLQAVIQLSQDVSGLSNLQDAIADAHVGISKPLQDSLVASASLKMATVTIGGDAKDLGQQHIPLKSEEIQNAQFKKSNTLQGIGTFQGTPVFIEKKRVETKLKRKLEGRVQELVQLLSQSTSPTFLTFSCLGYTEELSGFRLIFRLPTQHNDTMLMSLQDALRARSLSLPDLRLRHSLAIKICRTLLSFHNAGWLHKEVRSENIILIPDESERDSLSKSLEQPYLTGFSFARRDSSSEISERASVNPERDIYRHPEAQGESLESFERRFDVYALGCVLAEICDWLPLPKMVQHKFDPKSANFFQLVRQYLVERFIVKGYASFRLGHDMQQMMALCLCVKADGSERDDTPTLGEFYACLGQLEAVKV